MRDQFGGEIIGHMPALRAFAIAICGDRSLADDLVQETVLKAWAAEKQFERGTNLSAWLHTILRHCYFDYFRKAKRYVEDADGSYQGTLSEQPGQESRIFCKELRRALAQLTPQQREAVVLAGVAGFSYEEVARFSGCAVGTVKSRVSRARAALRVAIEGERRGREGEATSHIQEVRGIDGKQQASVDNGRFVSIARAVNSGSNGSWYVRPDTQEKVSLEELVKKIERCAKDADAQVLQAAAHLREARQRVENGEAGNIDWHVWAEENIHLSQSRLRELARIAEADDPEAELKRQRKLNSDRQKRHQKKKRLAPLYNGATTSKSAPKLEEERMRLIKWAEEAELENVRKALALIEQMDSAAVGASGPIEFSPTEDSDQSPNKERANESPPVPHAA